MALFGRSSIQKAEQFLTNDLNAQTSQSEIRQRLWSMLNVEFVRRDGHRVLLTNILDPKISAKILEEASRDLIRPDGKFDEAKQQAYKETRERFPEDQMQYSDKKEVIPLIQTFEKLYALYESRHEITTIQYGENDLQQSNALSKIKKDSRKIDPTIEQPQALKDLNRDTKLVEQSGDDSLLVPTQNKSDGSDVRPIMDIVQHFCGEDDTPAKPKTNVIAHHAGQQLQALMMNDLMEKIQFADTPDDTLILRDIQSYSRVVKDEQGKIKVEILMNAGIVDRFEQSGEAKSATLGADGRTLVFEDQAHWLDKGSYQTLVSAKADVNLKFDASQGKYYLEFTKMDVQLSTPDLTFKSEAFDKDTQPVVESASFITPIEELEPLIEPTPPSPAHSPGSPSP